MPILLRFTPKQRISNAIYMISIHVMMGHKCSSIVDSITRFTTSTLSVFLWSVTVMMLTAHACLCAIIYTLIHWLVVKRALVRWWTSYRVVGVHMNIIMRLCICRVHPLFQQMDLHINASIAHSTGFCMQKRMWSVRFISTYANYLVINWIPRIDCIKMKLKSFNRLAIMRIWQHRQCTHTFLLFCGLFFPNWIP